jgi:hypothetical protein
MLPGYLQLIPKGAKYHHDSILALRPSSTSKKTTGLLVTVLPMCISAGIGSCPLSTQDLRRADSLVHCYMALRESIGF